MEWIRNSFLWIVYRFELLLKWKLVDGQVYSTHMTYSLLCNQCVSVSLKCGYLVTHTEQPSDVV